MFSIIAKLDKTLDIINTSNENVKLENFTKPMLFLYHYKVGFW